MSWVAALMGHETDCPVTQSTASMLEMSRQVVKKDRSDCGVKFEARPESVQETLKS